AYPMTCFAAGLVYKALTSNRSARRAWLVPAAVGAGLLWVGFYEWNGSYQNRLHYLFELRQNTPDSNQLIAGTVNQLKDAHPVQSLAIWGWSPGVYVLTGLPPATRDAVIIGMAVGSSTFPLKDYYRERFLQDLRRSDPDMFVDTVARG